MQQKLAEKEKAAKEENLRMLAQRAREERAGIPAKPTAEVLSSWEESGVTEAIWGLPDKAPEEVEAFLDRHAGRLGIG